LGNLPPLAWAAQPGVGAEVKNNFRLCESGREITCPGCIFCLTPGCTFSLTPLRIPWRSHNQRAGTERTGRLRPRQGLSSPAGSCRGWDRASLQSLPRPGCGSSFCFQAGAGKRQGARAAPGDVCEVEQDVKTVSALWVVLGKSL